MIFKETHIKHPYYVAVLENGVTLMVFDGYAEGSDGKIYHYVDEKISDDKFQGIGWEVQE